jgi:hypothetical protein
MVFPARKAFSPHVDWRIAARNADWPLKARHGKFRTHFGPQFARGCSDSETLCEAMHKLDEPTLTRMLAAHDSGALEKIGGI